MLQPFLFIEGRTIFKNIESSLPPLLITPREKTKTIPELQESLKASRQKEQKLLESTMPKLRSILPKKFPFKEKLERAAELGDKNEDLRYAFFANADHRYGTEQRNIMRKFIDTSVDNAVGGEVPIRRGLTDIFDKFSRLVIKNLPSRFQKTGQATKDFLTNGNDTFLQGIDYMQSEVILDGESLTHKDIAQFFRIQIEINNNEIALTKAYLKNNPKAQAVAVARIRELTEENSVYEEIAQKAELADLTNRKIVLKQEINISQEKQA